MKNLGIIGGVGPQASAAFYSQYIELMIKKGLNKNCYVHNIGMNPKLFPKVISAENSSEKQLALNMLTESAKKLETVGADYITMVCNTLNIFAENIRFELKNAEYISIVEETIKKIKERGFKKIGLLGSEYTCTSKLYLEPLSKLGINTVTLDKKGLTNLNNTIIEEILKNGPNKKNGSHLNTIIEKMFKNEKGLDAVALVCTELPLVKKFIKKNQILDATEILLNAVETKTL